MIVQAIQFLADRPRQAVEPVVQTMLDFLNAAGVDSRGQLFPAARQVDGLLQERAQGFQLRLLPGGDHVVEFLAAAQQVAVAAALGDLKA